MPRQNAYLREFAALNGFARCEFFRLRLFLRLNDIRLRNCRKSKVRTLSMVDCLGERERERESTSNHGHIERTIVKVNYFWKIVQTDVNKSFVSNVVRITYRWLFGCCIVDGDEILRVTGIRSAFSSRTFNELVRNGDFLSDIRAKSDWFGWRREGRRRISISSILHSSIGNGMS